MRVRAHLGGGSRAHMPAAMRSGEGSWEELGEASLAWGCVQIFRAQGPRWGGGESAVFRVGFRDKGWGKGG